MALDIQAKVIADSVSKLGKRLTTLQLKFPRFILAEFNTHRVFSRNASSSRAIPIMRIIKEVWNNPVVPEYWGMNQSGMQAKTQLTGIRLKLAKFVWIAASKVACGFAYCFNKIGLHKQLSNRILESWMYSNVIVTSTEWDNFFELRDHEDAQPEIHLLAQKMKEAIRTSIPIRLNKNEWHLPYVTSIEKEKYSLDECIKMSVARCARVSYLTTEGKPPTPEEDFKLFDRLIGSVPFHASPAEHQGMPDYYSNESDSRILDTTTFEWAHKKYHGNFVGWQQFRKIYEERMKG